MNTASSVNPFLRLLALFLFSAALVTGCTSSGNNPVPANQRSHNPNGRNDDWGYIGIGGGGAMFNPEVSPYNPGYAFVSCDMTGSFVTYNGGSSWRMFNLRSPVNYYVFDPNDSNTVYANSIAL